MASKFSIQILGSDILSKKCRPFVVDEITNFDPAFFLEMHQFMIENHGAGLASPQIGDDRSYFIISRQYAIDGHWVFANPEIISCSDDACSFKEGCLSIPGLGVDVERPSTISIKAQDEHGKEFILHDVSGLAARIIQHEFDHVNGTLMIDKIDSLQRMMVSGKLKLIKRASKRNKG